MHISIHVCIYVFKCISIYQHHNITKIQGHIYGTWQYKFLSINMFKQNNTYQFRPSSFVAANRKKNTMESSRTMTIVCTAAMMMTGSMEAVAKQNMWRWEWSGEMHMTDRWHSARTRQLRCFGNAKSALSRWDRRALPKLLCYYHSSAKPLLLIRWRKCIRVLEISAILCENKQETPVSVFNYLSKRLKLSSRYSPAKKTIVFFAELNFIKIIIYSYILICIQISTEEI